MSSLEWEQIEQNISFAMTDIASLIVIMEREFDDNEQYRAKLINDLKTRYEKGRAAHADAGTTWDNWSAEDFVLNISEEIADCIIYGAAFVVKHNESEAIGDETDESR